MANYTKITDFAIKDELTSGDAGKVIRGSEFEVEFDNISTAIATKADKINPAFTGTATFVNAEFDSIVADTVDIAAGTITATFTGDLSYTPPGTNAEDTTVQAKLNEYSSAKDFGASGDGTTDDTTSFQNAVNNQIAVHIDDNTYPVSQVDLTSGLTIEGYGFDSVLKQNSLSGNYVIGTSLTGKSKLVLSKITLDGNKTLGTFTGTGHGLDLTGFDEVYIDTITIKNCTNHGLRIRGGSEKIYINNLIVHDNDSFGFTLEDSLAGTTVVSSVLISKIHAYNNGTPTNRYSGVNFGDTTNTAGPKKVLIGEIYAHDNERDGVAFGRNATGGNLGAQEIFVGSIVSFSNNDHGVEFFGCRKIQIGSIFAKGNAKHGVYITEGDDGNTLTERVQIGNIMAEENGYHGVYISTAKHISIGSIVSLNNSQNTSNTYDGVHLWPGAVGSYSPGDTLENIRIGSVTSFDTQGSATQRYGLRLQDGQDPAGGLYVGSFYGDGNATADLSTNAWGTLNDSFTLCIDNIQKCTAIEPSFSDNTNGASLKTAIFKVGNDFVARGRTTDGASNNLARIPLKTNALGILEAWVYGKDSSNSAIAAYKVVCRVNNTGASSGVTTVTNLFSSESTGSMDVSIIGAGAGTLFAIVKVTGVAGTTIDWECRASLRYNNELGS